MLRPRLAISMLVTSALSRSAAAGVPSAQEAAAEVIFRRAREHIAAGDFATACAELSESENLDPQIGTALNLASCYERLGRLATAWSLWLEAAAAARAKVDHDREDLAIRHARRLEAQLLHVTVTVAPQFARPRLRVAIDGALLPETEWGLPRPIDPGNHEVAASAEGFRAWSRKFMVSKGSEPVLPVPELEPLAESKPAGASGRWVVWAGAAAGAAALAGGAAFGVAALVNKNDASSNHNCGASGCNGTALGDLAKQHDDAIVADVLFASGGALLVTSALLHFSGAFHRTAAASSTWAVGAAASPSGLTAVVSHAW